MSITKFILLGRLSTYIFQKCWEVNVITPIINFKMLGGYGMILTVHHVTGLLNLEIMTYYDFN